MLPELTKLTCDTRVVLYTPNTALTESIVNGLNKVMQDAAMGFITQSRNVILKDIKTTSVATQGEFHVP